MTPQIIINLAGYAAMLGGILYLGTIIIFMMFHVPLDDGLMVTIRTIAWLLMVMPLATRWYLSEHMLLWLGMGIVAVGAAFKFRDWLSG